MGERRVLSGAVRLHLATSLDALVPALATNLWGAPGDVLSPLWCVVPTISLRSWVDQQIAGLDKDASGGVTANVRSILPKDLAVQVEKLVLGDEWVDFGTETMALRILGALHLERYEEAQRLAAAIDEVVRWRPHLLEPASRADLPTKVADAMAELDLFENGAHSQRSRVLDALGAGQVVGLPTRLSVFGLPEVTGGPRLLELLAALSTHVEVSAFVPVPDLALAAEVLEAGRGSGVLGWSRETAEALELWATLHPEVVFHEDVDRHPRTDTLGRLQQALVGGPVIRGARDDSVTLVGAFGDERQVEQVRDVIFDSIAGGIAPHEVLVVSPDPTSFAVALERHWNYQPSEDDGGPRLPYELTRVRPHEHANRLGLSLALLRLVGNYATVEQIADLLAMPAVASTLGLDLAAREKLLGRARQGRLIFGVTAAQRARFGVYEQDDGPMAGDVGTWERIVDHVAVASLYPPVREGAAVPDEDLPPLRPIGEPMDLAGFAALQPLLRILEHADELRAAPRLHRPGAARLLGEWLEQLESWMAVVASQASSGDDSFERALRKLRASLETVTGLGGLVVTFEQFLELWDSLAAGRSYSRLHGRRGVVVAGLEDFSWAHFKVVCILGLDDDKLPEAGLASPILATVPPGSPGRKLAGDPDVRRRSQAALLASVLSASERLVVSWNVSSEESGAAVEPAIVLCELLARLGDVAGVDGVTILEEQRSAVRRHGFFGDHPHTRYDRRLRRIDEERPQPLRDRVAPTVDDLTIDDLARFFRNPIGQHLRRVRNVLTPSGLEGAQVLPRITVDDMTKYRFRDQFVTRARHLTEVSVILESITTGEHFDSAFDAITEATAPLFAELLADPELAGDVPPIFWASTDLKAQLDLFVLNHHFDELDHDIVPGLDDVAYQPIDLGELGRLVMAPPHATVERTFEVRRQRGTHLPSVLHVHPSKGDATRAAGRIAQMLLELLSLRVNHPSEACRVVTYYLPSITDPYKRSPKGSSIPNGSRRLNPCFELSATPSTLPADQARAQLAGLVGLFHRAMREVPVLFRKTSEAAAFDAYSDGAKVTPWGEWSKFSFTGRESIGEQGELASRLLFPFSYQDLCRKTDFEQWAASLGEAGRGARWFFATDGMRAAPSPLLEVHEGFRAHREGPFAQALERAVQDDDQPTIAKYLGIGSPLLRAELGEDVG